MISLGQELKRERELRGISLQEIADSTRINLRFLQAIEDDRLHLIPGRFFVRAILRSYARTIGLDENQVLNRYQQLESYAVTSQEPSAEKKPESEPRRLGRRKIWLAGGLFVILIALLLFVFLRPSEKKPASAPASSSTLSANPFSAAVEVQVEEPSPEVQPFLDLELSFIDETWLQVFADGVRVFEGIKREGDSLRFSRSQEFVLDLGNAGGLTFSINGKRAKPLGPPGAVRKGIKISLDNYRQFLVGEEENRIPQS